MILHYQSFSPGSSKQPFVVEAIQSNFAKAAKQVKKDKKDRYNDPKARPTHHEVIAKTEFSTWEFILDGNEFMGPKLIWPKHLGSVFRGKWHTPKAGQLLQHTRDLVKTTREFRNRVSHHEPVWKRYGVSSEEDAIAHLHEKISRIMQLIAIISPEKEKLIIRNGWLNYAHDACSIEALRRCQHSS